VTPRAEPAASSDPPVRRIAVLTTGRQDWGILRSTCAALHPRSDVTMDLIAGGMHLSKRHGHTVDEIRDDGYEPVEVEWLDAAVDQPADIQAGTALARIGRHLRATTPDGLLLVGDRFETAAAALAATVCRIPIAHLHGGEQTLGAFDDALRHATTKLAHLHLVSHEEHARRVIGLGEDPASVHVVGAPGLDGAFRDDLLDRPALAADLGIELRSPVVIVTVHPTTLDADPAAAAGAVAAAMARLTATWIVTLPNVDPGSDRVRQAMTTAMADGQMRGVVVEALGARRYWSLLRVADVMLGNSSSGLVEAPAVALPVVNVGERQAGRRRWSNVVDVPADAGAVVAGVGRALDPTFRAAVAADVPPLADGRAGQRVADIIAGWRPSHPPRKPPVHVDP